jgi:hypothetical protein
LRTAAAQVLGRIPGAGDKALAFGISAGDARVREAALQGLLADRTRRRPLPAVLDSLRRIDPAADTARTRTMVDALGYVAVHTKDVDRALDRVLQRASALAPVVALARRRLSIGF